MVYSIYLIKKEMAQMALTDGFLDAKAASEYVGCSVSFIRVRARNGLLKHKRIGHQYLFTKSDLDCLIESFTPHNDKPDNLD